MVKEIKYRYEPDQVSPPGETLREIISDIGMTQSALAERTGRSHKTINKIIKGRDPITHETAILFERVLGVPAHFWNNRESAYRDSLARLKERERLMEQIDWLKAIPVNVMVKLGWIERYEDKVEQAREALNFFGVASPNQWRDIWLRGPAGPGISYRKSAAFMTDPGAVAAWLRKGILDAQNISCEPFDQVKFKNTLHEIRPLTLKPPEIFQNELIKLCSVCGVAVTFVPRLRKIPISGVTYWLTPRKALLQLSLRYKTDDQLWFSFFHEAGHILLHGKRVVVLEEDGYIDSRELEADRFAADVLIPPKMWKEFIRTGLLSKKAIKSFAEKINISPGIIVGRLQHDGILPFTHCNLLKRKLKWTT